MLMFASTMLATPDSMPPVPELNALEMPENMALTATPTKITRSGERPPRHDRLYTRPNAIRPPANANSGGK